MIDLMEALERIKQIALETGAMQKKNLGRPDLDIMTKSTGIDLVTEIDKQSEANIIQFIKQFYPDHDIQAEESGLAINGSDYRWIIDPLDGTTNYSQGLPIFAVSIALAYQGETVLGVVYTPVTDQLFSAVKGKGAWLNCKRLSVSKKAELIDCVLATGFPYDIVEAEANNISYFSELVLKARAVRRFGAAAYDLACVAAGNFDGYWEMKLSPWDVAAGILLVQEAGGVVIPFRDDRGISIVAANERIANIIMEEIRKVDGFFNR